MSPILHAPFVGRKGESKVNEYMGGMNGLHMSLGVFFGMISLSLLGPMIV